MRALKRLFWFILALVFLLEAWIWDTFAPLIARLVRLLPFERLKTAIADGIARLPPPITLMVFAIPGLILLPFKLAGLWLIGTGHPVLGIATFFLAKSVGVAVTAFLFHICQSKLMEMAWFRRVYAWFVTARAWAHRQTEPARALIRLWRERIRLWIAPWRGRGGLMRAARRLRAAMRRSEAR